MRPKEKINEALGWIYASFWLLILIVHFFWRARNPGGGWLPEDSWLFIFTVGAVAAGSFLFFVAQMRKKLGRAWLADGKKKVN